MKPLNGTKNEAIIIYYRDILSDDNITALETFAFNFNMLI